LSNVQLSGLRWLTTMGVHLSGLLSTMTYFAQVEVGLVR